MRETLPAGLELSREATRAEAEAQATLPAFGMLCSRAARGLGLGPMACASRGQRPWVAAAKRTLGAMAEGGAPVGGYRFIALDERKAMAILDDAVAYFKGEEFGWGRQLLTNREWRSRRADGSTRRAFTGASLEDGASGAMFRCVAAFFESPDHARAQGIGHEFGHAWQAATGHPMLSAACAGQSGPLAEAVKSLAWRAATSERRPAAGKGPDAMVAKMVEESVCDAIGCWAVERAYGVSALRPMANFREAVTREAGLDQYSTQWLMRLLEAAHPAGLPERFPQLVEAVEAGIRAAAPILTGGVESVADFCRNPMRPR